MWEGGKRERKLSRREVLFGGAGLAAGAIATNAVSSCGMGLSSRADAREITFPWPYEKIDLQEVAQIAYESFYKDLCCYGVSRGIMVPLQEKIGEPYISQPLYEGLKLGAGGIAEWGTVCGALLGATVITGFMVPLDAGKQIINELFQWYSDSPFPVYEPDKPKTQVSVQSISDSPLCHISVGKWLKSAGRAIKSPEQRERCARLTADVAIRTAMLLNEWKDGKFHSVLNLPIDMHGITSQSNCTECHTSKVPMANR